MQNEFYVRIDWPDGAHVYTRVAESLGSDDHMSFATRYGTFEDGKAIYDPRVTARAVSREEYETNRWRR